MAGQYTVEALTFTYVCRGVVPSKKNSRVNFVHPATGRQVSLPSKEYREWEKRHKVLCQMKYGYGKQPITQCESIVIDFYLPDKRRRDLSNMVESIMDMLVAARVLKDDCWTVTGPTRHNPHLDKDNPRCEVTICIKPDDQGDLFAEAQ